MSEERLKAFMEAVMADAGLQEQLKAAVDADAVMAIAKAAGFLITTEAVNRAQQEISDEELEGVAGGGGVAMLAVGHKNWGFHSLGVPGVLIGAESYTGNC